MSVAKAAQPVTAAVTPVVVKPAPKEVQPQPVVAKAAAQPAQPRVQDPPLTHEVLKPYPVKHVSAWDSMAPHRAVTAPAVAPPSDAAASNVDTRVQPAQTKRTVSASKATATATPDEGEYTEIKAPASNQYLSYSPPRKSAAEEAVSGSSGFTPHVLKAASNAAWVQVSPSQTVMVRPGEDVPGLGKVTSINAKELVTDKSRLAVPQE
ncbi:hypothetical protein F6X40_10655 [Paraburkholderia sp. UCT31]|uniref:hypothetical protein n=1 Tax=Paraburkholderia sp. UCT31 TaxID=2615209 RepID=UPI001655655C|nr:hypothetical protein [Paraburkholderia sp. UCT31]MBC8737268.1 hypothetical protein [Paraburkholderia sp. UCT31]